MGDIERLEAERLHPQPPELSRADRVAGLIGQLIAVLAGAIERDQAEGKWGRRR